MKWMKDNGLKVVISIAALALAVGLAVQGAGRLKGSEAEKISHNHEEIVGVKAAIKDEIKPALSRAIKHVDQEEIDTPRIKSDIAGIRTDFKDFTTEQRSVNKEILLRLPKPE